MKLIFIRHGDPDYEKDSLTEKGWREAEILAKRVATWDIKQIYCSPLGRAKDTCSLSLKATGREAITCEWLQEFYYRVWDEAVQEWTIGISIPGTSITGMISTTGTFGHRLR